MTRVFRMSGMTVLNPLRAKSSARSWTRLGSLHHLFIVEGSWTYAVVYELDAEDVRQEKDDLVFGVFAFGSRDVAVNAADLLHNT